MDKKTAAARIIAEALPIVPFTGWSRDALKQAAAQAGYKESDLFRLFPGGAIDAVDLFSRVSDEAMLVAFQAQPRQEKMRERITAAVRARIGMHAGHREAVRKALAMHALPLYAPRGLRCLYDTVDTIWHAAGDTSVDFSFYTKRLSLAAVYSATLLFWLNDRSEGSRESWAFLDRRIENVMQFGKWKSRLFQRRA